MAATSVPRSTPDILTWLRKRGSSLGRPLFAVLLALIAGSIIIFIVSPGAADVRFNTIITAYQSLYQGAFGDGQSFSFTLVRGESLILAGLSVAIAFRAGLFNIGAAGQLAMGAMAALIIGHTFRTAPGWLLIPLMIIGSIVVGGIWGGIVGLLKAWRGAHEVVTTIMLNWIAFYFTDFLIDGPFKAPNQATQTSPIPVQSQLPLVSSFYNDTLGKFLPQIQYPLSYRVDVSIFLALLALVVYWFITARTAFGYEIRVIGQNQRAAKYAGMPIKRNLSLAMALAGGFAGLAGGLHLMGQSPYQLIGSTFSIDSTGFDAIGVALLGRTSAIGVLLSALLFGGLRQGAGSMQLNTNIPGDIAYIIQALILFSIATEFLPAIQRSLPRWIRTSRRPALVPDLTGTPGTEVAIPEQTAPTSQNGQSEPGIPTETAVAPQHPKDQVEES